jgi:hypothetical protein
MLSLLAQTPESKKEEFRKYLEKSGVIDALTKVLVGLYEEPERPANAVDYIKRYMGAPTGVDVEASTTNRWRSVYHSSCVPLEVCRCSSVLVVRLHFLQLLRPEQSRLRIVVLQTRETVDFKPHLRSTCSTHSCLPFAASCTGNQAAK